MPPAYDETPARATYERYIASEAWRGRRERYFAVQPRRCKACGAAERVHLHHLSYAKMGREPDSDLMALCEPCHDLVHRFYRATDAGTLRQATYRVVGLVTGGNRYAAAVKLPGGIDGKKRRKRRPQRRRPKSGPGAPRKGALSAAERTGSRPRTRRELWEDWDRKRRLGFKVR